jgi:hypothetical protein
MWRFFCLQVFLTRDGRISIAGHAHIAHKRNPKPLIFRTAGLNDANVGKLADAIKNVVTDSSLSAAL